MKRAILFLAAVVIAVNLAYSQGTSINNSGAKADTSAILDLSSKTKGFLLPRMTTAERNSIVSPASGLQIYNTTTKCFEFYENGGWYNMACVCTPPDVPVATTASGVSATQMTANWNTATGGTGYYLDVATDAGFTAIVAGYNSLNVNNVLSYNITGLSCGTTYYYRVRAYNSCGTCGNSNTVSQATSTCWTCGLAFTDTRDSKSYNTLLIGSQCWMKQNLNYGTEVTLATGQGAGGTQKYCYGDISSNCNTYGGLYEWTEVMNGSSSCNGSSPPPEANARCVTPVTGVCPPTWHVPSHYEWNLLQTKVGSCPGCFPYNTTTYNVWLGVDEGTNLKQGGSSGFEALLAGFTMSGAYTLMGTKGPMWSSTEYDGSTSWSHEVDSFSPQVVRYLNAKNMAMPVRCVKD